VDFGKTVTKDEDEALKNIIAKKLANDPLRVTADQLKEDLEKKSSEKKVQFREVLRVTKKY